MKRNKFIIAFLGLVVLILANCGDPADCTDNNGCIEPEGSVTVTVSPQPTVEPTTEQTPEPTPELEHCGWRNGGALLCHVSASGQQSQKCITDRESLDDHVAHERDYPGPCNGD